MNTLQAFFKLIRWKNLLIIFLTQYIIWQFVIVPTIHISNTEPFLTPIHFLLLSLSTICIAAAGYIINDYFDVRIDAINKPDEVIIGKYINKRWAMSTHFVLNILGVMIGMVLVIKLNNWWPISIQFFTTILLWFYSTSFKRQNIIGNIVVALLAGLTVLILACYEPIIMNYWTLPKFIHYNAHYFPNPIWTILIYGYFAFMLTWMREVIKDMEDFEGDLKEGCNTMPIKIGLKRTSYFVVILGILAVIPLSYASYKLITGGAILLAIYLILLLLVPTIYTLIRISKKTTTRHYQWLSKVIKAIMIAGLFALVVYYINL